MPSTTPGNGPETAQKISITTTGKMGPFPPNSPAFPCAACLRPIAAGQFYTTIPIGCGADPENRRRARQGFPFPIVFVAVHWGCFQGDESESHLSL